jgi:hypothetical protein
VFQPLRNRLGELTKRNYNGTTIMTPPSNDRVALTRSRQIDEGQGGPSQWWQPMHKVSPLTGSPAQSLIGNWVNGHGNICGFCTMVWAISRTDNTGLVGPGGAYLFR